MNVLSIEDLAKISKAVNEHKANVEKIGKDLLIITQEIDTTRKEAKIIESNVVQIANKIDIMNNDCKKEAEKVNDLQKELNKIDSRVSGITNRAEYIKTQEEFKQFENTFKECITNIQNEERKCVQLRKKANEQAMEAKKQQDLLHEKEKQNLQKKQEALEIWEKSLDGLKSADDIWNTMASQVKNNDFATSQAIDIQNETKISADNVRNEAKNVLQLCTKTGDKITQQMERNKDVLNMCTKRSGQVHDEQKKIKDLTRTAAQAASRGINNFQQSKSQAVKNNGAGNDEMPFIDEFLQKLDLQHLERVFKSNGILTKENLKQLYKSDLKDIGIEILATRNTIWRAIEKL